MSTTNTNTPSNRLSRSNGLGTMRASSLAARSPRTGSAAAPVTLPGSARSPRLSFAEHSAVSPRSPTSLVFRRCRSSGEHHRPSSMHGKGNLQISTSPGRRSSQKSGRSLRDSAAQAQSRSARKLNDSMVYLDGPQIYACAQCRTHLTNHDEIISKSFHGRHGRAYLFDHCVNVTIGPAEDRALITGLHSVCDIFCKRCNHMVGWTYAKAYEASQKYKEGKFIVEKINLHLEESDCFNIAPPAGERKDRFRARSISWGSDYERGSSETIYEYRPGSPFTSLASSK
ncbi:Yippee zinc-binding/DNA-binding /Mis18, centromere assembly family protein [Nitzschia inconspicua]|uniref:Yippee zinc-binding/DNA-binding /Mis18, centromere assembly family protein n=1 Tax=Nitzschia inconspicua TaxID=303405 RepID=A0A9K3L8K9_9STRA|nr:Yippee zinc-binding/DNA-binding /Mis18, centromere assembly family protein [Nitzschia inconspicua]